MTADSWQGRHTAKPNHDRQSHAVKRESFRALSEPEKAQQEALNTLRQYDRMVKIINEALRSTQRFRLRPSAILELNRISIQNLEVEAGRWRDSPVVIEGSRHQPPPADEVARHVDELCDYVNDNWETRGPFHLAAYVMWRLNWIHPFVDGNGRTTRAVSYYVLCSKLGFHIPGVKTVPEMIAQDKEPYYSALEAADEAEKSGSADVSQMQHLLSELLAKQMVLALEAADAPNTKEPTSSPRIQNGSDIQKTRITHSTELLRSTMAVYIGIFFLILTLLFLMCLVLMSTWGRVVPHESQSLIVMIFALAGGGSATLLGGNMIARGSIPIPLVEERPIQFACTGGIAVLVVLMLLGRHLLM
jgi:fido (protein-threonine AMPylation protein)